MLLGDSINHPQDFSTLPIADITALTTPSASEEEKGAAGKAIDEAFQNSGFLYVVGHGVDSGLRKRVLELGREFFALEEERKERISIKRQEVPVRGYQRIGDNVTGGHSDWHEAIDLYRQLPLDHPLRTAEVQDAMHSDNQWPETPAEFRKVYETYVDEMLRVGRAVMEGVARARGLPAGYFERFYDDSYWVMRSIYYPPLDSTLGLRAPGDFGCGEHTDYGCLTFVNCEPVLGALEVRNRRGDWIKADPLPDAFIVNVGDMLSHWSNGVYRSTPHRVQSVSGTDRVSVPFFFEPNYDARISPIVQAFGGKEEEGKEVVFGRHLAKRVLSNFKYSPNVETDNASRDIA
ncbi:hypothetical protein HDU67_003465 [Dinochytrium kinnereticum]|nr:hypothetical protein HDU67_003465 [Dinochytrium kinnereticum]